jgi:glutamate synthase domain-containing protein 2/rubredoxin
MAVYVCAVCGYMYDEDTEETAWADLPGDWICPVCGNGKEYYFADESTGATASATGPSDDSDESGSAAGRAVAGSDVRLAPLGEAAESHLADIDIMSETGESIIEPMRTREPVISWDEILVLGAQIARLPLNEDEPVSTRTVIGPGAKYPLEIDAPLIISHMSFGALSREAKLALARGSAAVRTAMSSGEGGILPEAMDASYRYIFEYVPNRYSVSEEYLQKVDAVEIKLGQSAKPGMGGHLPGHKVTAEIARVRGFAEGQSITSPAHHADISTPAELAAKVEWLREATGGKPVGVKLAAGDVEADMDAVVAANPDFVTIDGRAGATGAAPKYIKRSASVPTIFALERARNALDARGSSASLIVTGGLRISSDFAKALAMGADAVALGTAALIAIGCRQYRICHTGRCPVGITSQDPELRRNQDWDHAALRLERFLNVSVDEIRAFARLTGHDDVHSLTIHDLCTTNSEISEHTRIRHA